MKKLILVLLVAAIFSCNKEKMDELNNNSAAQLSINIDCESDLLGLDKVPIYPNEFELSKLLENPDDLSDQKMGHLIYKIQAAVKPLINDCAFNQLILDLSKLNDNHTVSLLDLKAKAPDYYKKINKNLKGGETLDQIAKKMIYVDPGSGKSSKYVPGIYVPNRLIADGKRRPLLSAQLEYIGEDIEMEDYILCVYNNGNGFAETWVGPNTAEVSSNPIFIIDNIQETNYLNAVTPSDDNIINGGTTSFANSVQMLNDIEYDIDEYKIAHRYDRSRRSEYSYEMIYHYVGGEFDRTGTRTLVKRIHKNDINTLFYEDFNLWQINLAPGDILSVSIVTFEHDWWASNKTIFISGVSISIRTKYADNWYQITTFPYSGADQVVNTKGLLKLKSDVTCTDCPPGYSYDGANCYSGIQAPEGYNPFIFGSSFYVQQNCTISTSNNCCPDGFGWDTANCHSGIEIPEGWHPFIWNGGFYVVPQCL